MIFRFWPFYSRKNAGGTPVFQLAVWILLLAAGSSAPAFTTNDASTIFESYAKAFYSLKGDNGYFKKDQAGGTADFWEQAEEIECVIDACERKTNPAYKAMAARLLNGFTKKNGGNWAKNTYNDDCMWASIAFARGYLNTGNVKFKIIARANFDRTYARSWDSALGGGLYWTTANSTKNACVNGPGGIAACLLYQIYGDTNYLVKARNIFNWERAHLFDPDTGAVSDGMSTNGTVSHWASTYNQGTFIGLANFLGETNDAARAANFTKESMTRFGILPPYGAGDNNSGFNAIFIRWLAKFMNERGRQNDYQAWLQENADAAWNVRRASDNLSWCQWRRWTPAGKNLGSWDCIASVEALQAVPPTTAVSTAPVALATNVTQNP